MKQTTSFFRAPLFKTILFVAIFLAGYWFLDHWDDFKAGFAAGVTGQAKPRP